MEMEMEKEEEHRVVVEDQEQQQEEDDDDESSSLLLRKSRFVSDGITDETNNNGVVVDVGASNRRISVNNGHAAILSNGAAAAAAAKNEDSSPPHPGGIDDDEKTEEEELLDAEVLENGSEEESKNREKKSENLIVFYERDHQEKQVHEDPAPDELDSSNGINSPTEKEYEGRHVENGSSSNSFILHQNNSSTENKYERHLENESLSSPPSKSSFQEANTSYGSSKEIESAAEEVDDDLINEEEEEVDLDVENVLMKQTTHTLHCPNCNSCITRRVILRKRKRRTTPPRLTTSDEDAKRNNVDQAAAAATAVQQQALYGGGDDQVEVGDATTTSTETPTREDEEPDVFRCLACFSFFIPCVDGSKLFRKFGGKSGKENVQGGEQQEPSAKKNNWFSFMFASSNKQEDETQVVQGGSNLPISSHKGDHSEQGQVSNQTLQLTDGASSEDKDALQQQQQQHDNSMGEGSGFGTMSISVSAIPPHDDDQGQQVGAYILTHSVVENQNASFSTTETGQVYPFEFSQHTITDAKYEVHTGETLNLVDNNSSVTGVSVTQGKDTVITIGTQHAESPQTLLQGITPPTASATALVSSGTQIVIRDRETSEARKLEVIKSIVYGGLAESITSLSVVSSAAGGGAATLNILALGMANLIGGLFIICHNLWELRSDLVEQVSNQITDEVTNRTDRYKELLGRRENFILHAVVAIISYLVFGLVPPLVYGFSFRKSDDNEFKLLGVAAASFVCVVILALGKAYVQRPPKTYIKSVSTYVILGFMVSGVSYAAGVLVERLLQELALFDPTTSGSSNNTLSSLLLPQTESAAAAWSSY